MQSSRFDPVTDGVLSLGRWGSRVRLDGRVMAPVSPRSARRTLHGPPRATARWRSAAMAGSGLLALWWSSGCTRPAAARRGDSCDTAACTTGNTCIATAGEKATSAVPLPVRDAHRLSVQLPLRRERGRHLPVLRRQHEDVPRQARHAVRRPVLSHRRLREQPGLRLGRRLLVQRRFAHRRERLLHALRVQGRHRLRRRGLLRPGERAPQRGVVEAAGRRDARRLCLPRATTAPRARRTSTAPPPTTLPSTASPGPTARPSARTSATRTASAISTPCARRRRTTRRARRAPASARETGRSARRAAPTPTAPPGTAFSLTTRPSTSAARSRASRAATTSALNIGVDQCVPATHDRHVDHRLLDPDRRADDAAEPVHRAGARGARRQRAADVRAGMLVGAFGIAFGESEASVSLGTRVDARDSRVRRSGERARVLGSSR